MYVRTVVSLSAHEYYVKRCSNPSEGIAYSYNYPIELCGDDKARVYEYIRVPVTMFMRSREDFSRVVPIALPSSVIRG